MAFDEQLRGYLENLGARNPKGRHRRVDVHALRRFFLHLLRELEENGVRAGIPDLFETWSPRLPALAKYIEELPVADAPVVDEQAQAFAGRLIDLLPTPLNPSDFGVEELELKRLLDGFQLPIESYALENQLLQRTSPLPFALTGLGRPFLRLRGRDAVRWLLTIEISLSCGARDPYRVSQEGLRQVVSRDRLRFDNYYDWISMESLNRLISMGVLEMEPGQPATYRVASSMRDLVQSVLDAGPWHAAVTALLEDERGLALGLAGPRATEATIEQTRLIAHEVRNALIPVRHHLDALQKASEEPQRARLATSHRGVARVLAFIDEMVATSELVSEPATSFEIGDVIREAIGWHEARERVESEPSGAIRCRAPRSRVLRAISNVVLNALQATDGQQRVRIRTRLASGHLEIAVDDAGPGVPEELRTTIFRDGFTTRAGGSGFGLAYVRRVVEDLQGRVWCEQSDLGGARFVMAIPEGDPQR